MFKAFNVKLLLYPTNIKSIHEISTHNVLRNLGTFLNKCYNIFFMIFVGHKFYKRNIFVIFITLCRRLKGSVGSLYAIYE